MFLNALHNLRGVETKVIPKTPPNFGFLFLTLLSQSVHVHECTHLCAHTHTHTHTHTHCYVNSLYTIFVTHTAHTNSAHTHTHVQYTCIVMEMESCAQHIHTLMYSTLVRTHTMKNIEQVYTHTHTHTHTCHCT